MAKAKKTKTSRAKISSSGKRNLLIVGIILICLGLLLFVIDHKKQKEAEYLKATPEQFVTPTSTDVSPSEGCKLIATNYICDIKITNPLEESLDWSSLVTGIEGASISNGGSGTLAAGDSTTVQLTVPKAFCDTNPEGAGSILVLQNSKSSNQAETKFTCTPADAVSESPANN